MHPHSKHRLPPRARRRRTTALALAVAASGCAGFARDLPTPARDVSAQLERLGQTRHVERLDNGARLLLVPDARANLVQIDVRVAAGSRDDPPGKGGLAHVVEHMTFEYVADWDAAAAEPALDERVTINEQLEAVSLYHNAFTSPDVTHYTTTGLAADVERLLELELARLRSDCAALSPARFERELNVVANELRQLAGDRERYLERALTAASFPKGHPYRDPIEDDELELAAITRADVCAFTRRRYTPDAIDVIITGAFDPKRVRPLARRSLAAIPQATALPHPPLAGSDRWAFRYTRERVQAAVDRPGVALVLASPERFTLAVGDGPPEIRTRVEPSLQERMIIARLRRALHELARAHEAVADTRLLVLGGAEERWLALYAAAAAPDDDGLRATEKALLAMLDQLHRGTDDAKRQTQHAKQRLMLRTLQNASQQRSRGALLADLLSGAREQSVAESIRALEELDPVKATVWVERFADNKKKVIWLTPSGEDPAPPRAGRFMASASVTSAPPRDLHEAALDTTPRWTAPIQEFTLDDGMRVILAPTDGLPLVELRLLFDVGTIDAPREQPALARLVADWITPYRSGMTGELYNAYFDAGADAARGVSTETTEFRVTGLAGELDHLLGGLSTFTADGVFDPATLDGERKVLRAQLGRRDVEGRLRAEQRLNAAVFGERHPYARRSEPTLAQLAALTDAELRAFKRRHYRAASATLIVTGRFNPELAAAHVQARFQDRSLGRRIERWDRAPEPRDRPSVALQAAPDGARDLALAEDDATQSSIYIALPLPGLAGERHGARLVMVELLDDFVGRVREQLGASYGINAYLEGDTGLPSLTIYGQVDPARTGEALTALRESLERVQADATHEGRFARARRTVLRRLLADAGDPETLASRLSFTARRDLPHGYFATVADQVARLQPGELALVMREELDPARARTLCIGARARVIAGYREAGVETIEWVR